MSWIAPRSQREIAERSSTIGRVAIGRRTPKSNLDKALDTFIASLVSPASLIQAFRQQVAERPDAVALIVDVPGSACVPLSWAQLARRVVQSAAVISEHLDSNDLPRRIGHASDNSLADILIALASMWIGAVEIPIDSRLPPSEIERRWNRVGGLWIQPDLRRRLSIIPRSGIGNAESGETPPAAIDADAPSLILWTSGTTGTPQGVMLSQRNLAGNAAAKLRAVPQQTDDVRLCMLPLSHAYARTCDFGTWLLSGCTLALTQGYSGVQRFASAADPTLINSVPRLAYRLLADQPRLAGLKRLRLLGCGGAPISEAAFLQWKSLGVTVIQGYGLTEASPVVCSATPQNASPGLVGEFVAGWQSEIRQGQLFVRGPHTMLGYWQAPEATAEKIDRDGWLATGDLVQQDGPSGQWRVLGRCDEVIVLDSAKKIFPSTIEREIEVIGPVRHAFLVHRGDLELWIDGEAGLEADIARVLERFPECHPCVVKRFSTPLEESSGELTSKGTIRRAHILKTRFGIDDQAGS